MSKKGFAPTIIVLIIALLAVGVVSYIHFQSGNKPIISTTTTTTLSPGGNIPEVPPSASVIEANNRFAIDLFSRYSTIKTEDEDIFFSPFSISSAIAMTYEGAKGETAAEIQNVFHFPTDIQKLREDYQNIYDGINTADKPYTLSTANALWVQKDYKLFDNYVDTVKTYYDGGITNLDFLKPQEAVNTINTWVEDQTHDRIKDLLSREDINPLTRSILTNAIYFKGEWASKFSKGLTKEKDFTMTDGTKHEISMMQQTSHFEHAQLKNVSILKLPYKGGDLSMLVVLPTENNLSDIEKTISYQQLNEWKSKMEDHKVEVHLPKFKIETKESMARDLAALGMPISFSGSKADFSGMAPISPSQNLYIGQVIHQTFIENNEDGTEAAAATAVVIVATGMPPGLPEKLYIFNANHPFIFLIQQNKTGNILFMGRVVKS